MNQTELEDPRLVTRTWRFHLAENRSGKVVKQHFLWRAAPSRRGVPAAFFTLTNAARTPRLQNPRFPTPYLELLVVKALKLDCLAGQMPRAPKFAPLLDRKKAK